MVRVHHLNPLRDGQACVGVATPLPERLRSCLLWWKKHAPRGVVNLIVRGLLPNFILPAGIRKEPPPSLYELNSSEFLNALILSILLVAFKIKTRTRTELGPSLA